MMMITDIHLQKSPKLEFLFLEQGFQVIDEEQTAKPNFFAYRDIESIEINKPWFPTLAKWLRITTWILNGVPYFPDAGTCKKANLIIRHKKRSIGYWLTDSKMVTQAKAIQGLLQEKLESKA